MDIAKACQLQPNAKTVFERTVSFPYSAQHPTALSFPLVQTAVVQAAPTTRGVIAMARDAQNAVLK
jgi:hypothetical protein